MRLFLFPNRFLGKLSVIFLLIGLSWLVYDWYENRPVEIQVCSGQSTYSLRLPHRHKLALEYFFKETLIADDAGYTLFDSKPLWMGGYIRPFTLGKWEHFLASISPPNLRMYNGWKTWQRYQKNLPISNFEMWEEENPFWARFFPVGKNPAISILMVNKKKFQETLHRHRPDFFEVLGVLNADDLLLNNWERPLLGQKLCGHEGLIGTLFGYGRENAWLFHQRESNSSIRLEFPWEQEVLDFYNTHPRDWRWKWLGFFPSNFADYLGYPCFAADLHSEETRKIKKAFLETRKEILAYYSNCKEDFLERTLSKLLESDTSPEGKGDQEQAAHHVEPDGS